MRQNTMRLAGLALLLSMGVAEAQTAAPSIPAPVAPAPKTPNAITPPNGVARGVIRPNQPAASGTVIRPPNHAPTMPIIKPPGTAR